MKLTLQTQLLPTQEQVLALEATMRAFNAAADWLAGEAFARKTANKILLQKLYYAELPTPGPWAACRTNSGTFVKSERLAGYFVGVRHCRTAQDVNADAHLIAACDPDTIRALLDERDALAAEVERLEKALKDIQKTWCKE